MSGPQSPQAEIADTIFEMEDRVANLVRWSRVIQDLGSVHGDVAADGLFAVGTAMLNDAKFLQDDWKRCVELIQDVRGVGR